MSDFRKIYQINIESLFQNGTSCSNPTITWEKPDCINVRCELQDGKILKVEVPEDCDDGCIYVNIDCGAECGDCEPHRLKICPCSENVDCEDCETCVGNVCVSKCEPDEFCDEGKCVECDPEHPCDCNKACVAGKCVCPPELPYEDDRGCCKTCLDDGDCPKCYYCTPNGCVPKECTCDPDTGDCVECYNSGHCDENECCVNKKCDCCPGFYRNPQTGDCEPQGCVTDADCGPCKVCDDGDCVQITCPEGFVYTGGTPCCAKRCDCDDPDCPSGQDCVRLNVVDCYCTDCSGDCTTDNDCEMGCECDDDTSNCVKKGCDGPCDTASDCGDGCGCFQGECVDCSELTCEQCMYVSGCSCVDDSNCVSSPCNNPCVSEDDCDFGCGCDSDGECIQCSNVSCNSHTDCPYGCYCDEDSSKCKPNPCSGPCLTGSDCAPGCTCEDERCVPCDPSDPNCGGGDDECLDLLQIIKHDNDCNIEGKLTTDGCCDCDSIGVNFDFNSVVNSSGTLTYELDSNLRIGEFTDITSFLSLPLLSATGVVNELPNQGTIKVTVEVTYHEVDSNGNFIPGGTSFVVSVNDTEDYSASDTEEFDLSHANIGVMHSNGTHKVIKIDVYAETTVDFEFPNECTYFIPKTKVFSTSVSTGISNTVNVALKLTKKSFCRLPLFAWYESVTSNTLFNTGNIFRKVYAQRIAANMYNDIIDVAEGLEVCKYYGLKNTCGCDNQTAYSCYNNETVPNKLMFCSPEDLEVLSQNSCNTSVKIKEADVCSILEGESFDLYINGDLYNSYTVTGGKLFAGDLTITLLVPIFEVRLVFPCDDCSLCTIIKTLELLEPCACSGSSLVVTLGDHDCALGFTYTVTGGTAPYFIRVVHIDSQNNEHAFMDTDVASGTITGPLTNGQYIVKVTDALGCIEQVTKVVEDCCVFDVASATYSCTTQKVSIVFNSVPTNATATLNGSTVNVVAGIADFGALTNGTYTLIVEDDEGCPESISLAVNCCDSIVIDSITSTDCETLTLSLSGAGSAGVDQYRIDHTGPWVAFVPPTIALGSPLSTGYHAVCVRDASFPSCYVCAAYRCTTCPTYDLDAIISLDCDESAIVLTSVLVPSNPNNCSNYTWKIYKNSGTTPVASGTYSWATFATTMEFPITNIGNGGTYRLVITDCNDCVVYDDSVTSTPLSLNVAYDCSTFLSYSYSPGGAALTYQCVSGCNPAIPAGTPAPTAGTSLSDGSYVFTLTDGSCTLTQSLVVSCGGGGGVDPDCPLVDGVDFVVTQAGCNFTITNNSIWTLTAYLETVNNLPNFCTGTVIKTVTIGTVSPSGGMAAGNILYNGYAHRLRITYATDPGAPSDPQNCSVTHCLSACAGVTPCEAEPTNFDVCVQTRLTNPKLSVTNLNGNPVVLFVSRTSSPAATFTPQIIASGATWITQISQDAALPNNVGTYYIKAVCVYDQTTFWEDTLSGLAQIPDC